MSVINKGIDMAVEAKLEKYGKKVVGIWFIVVME